MSPIFGNSSLGGTSNGNRHLVEFRAGRMNMVGKMVHPDQRKGLVYVYQAEDALVHFCWKDVTTGNVEDDLIIFPDDCEFKRVDQCKTGRVFLLKFKSSTRKLFFWMQEAKPDKDEDFCRRVNDAINNPPPANSGGRGGGGGGGADNNDIQYMINNMSQQQLMQLFNGVGQMSGLSSFFGSNRSSENSRSSPTSRTAAAAAAAAVVGGGTPPAVATSQSTTTPQAPRKVTTTRRTAAASDSATPANGSAGNAATDDSNDQSRVLLSELRYFLSGLPNNETTEAGVTGGAGGTQTRSAAARNVDFSTSLTSETLTPILDNPDWIANLEQHLPDIGDTDESKRQQLRDTIASPQFQQALSMFSTALQSGQLGPVVSQFKLSGEAVEAANQGDLEQFVKALEKSAKELTGKKEETPTATTIKAANSSSSETATAGGAAKEEATSVPAPKKKEDEQQDDEMLG